VTTQPLHLSVSRKSVRYLNPVHAWPSHVERITFRQRFPNLFEHDPNLSVVNTSRPKPQTAYEKNNDCMDEFWQQIGSSLSVSGIYSSLKYLRNRQTQTSSGNLGNMRPRFGSPRRDTFFDVSLPCLGRDPYLGNHCLTPLLVAGRFYVFLTQIFPGCI